MAQSSNFFYVVEILEDLENYAKDINSGQSYPEITILSLLLFPLTLLTAFPIFGTML